MALPPGFLDDLRARVPISEIVGRRVSWDAKKSNKARGDLWACCPFHEEKSPSFHVDDRKGFYKCFGCGASGDAIKFLCERENMGFMEAVAEMARVAGVPMPAENPEAAARAEKAQGLALWMEAAAQFYRTQLSGARAQAARAYLSRRGLSAETIARFELGYAPGDRHALLDHLKGKGAGVPVLAEAGLIGLPEGGGSPYDRFRDRIMFPIRDARGRCIAFGGRAIQPGQEPKYLNSPETPLFDKSRTLYHIGPAREAAGKAKSLIVVEGYMDVIGLAQAGLGHAVAPLGTAITEMQLEMMWRLCPEPVLALDGDAAGLRAAMRVVDLALPMLGPGRSLRFALLPPGQDPDDLARGGGAAAVTRVLDAAEPLVALLWRRETEGRSFDSPERRAALDAALRAALGRIGDTDLRRHYRDALAERRAALFGAQPVPARPEGRSTRRSAGGRGRPGAEPSGPMPQTRGSRLAREASADAVTRGREAAILLIVLRHPALLARHVDALAETLFGHADLDAVRLAALAAVHDTEGDIPATDAALCSAVAARIGEDPVARLMREPHLRHLAFVRADSTVEAAQAALVEALGRQRAFMLRRSELDEAIAALTADDTEGGDLDALDQRLRQMADEANRQQRGRMPENAEDEGELSRWLKDATESEIWIKRKRGRSPNR